MQKISIVYATSTGNTLHTVQTVASILKASDLDVQLREIDEITPEDLLDTDFLILASGTWNAGGREGQLHPDFHTFVAKTPGEFSLRSLPCAVISLGDERYYYTGRATEYLTQFVIQHEGTLASPPLLIINSPYGQEDKMKKWAESIAQNVSSPVSG